MMLWTSPYRGPQALAQRHGTLLYREPIPQVLPRPSSRYDTPLYRAHPWPWPQPQTWDLIVQGPAPPAPVLPDMFKLVQLVPQCTGPQPHPIPTFVQTCSLWSTNGWQTGGSHPTRMLSCSICIFFNISLVRFNTRDAWFRSIENTDITFDHIHTGGSSWLSNIFEVDKIFTMVIQWRIYIVKFWRPPRGSKFFQFHAVFGKI